MTVEELEQLRKKAEKRLCCWVRIQFGEEGSCLIKRHGREDLIDVTVDQVIAKLKEWAMPPKPANIAVMLPYEEVSRLANVESGKIGEACREAIAPYES